MYTETRPPSGVLPGEWTPSDIALDAPHPHVAVYDRETLIFKPEDSRIAWLVRDVLTDADCEKLRAAMLASGNLRPVSIQGRTDVVDDRVGSVRAVAWAPELAAQLWEKIRNSVPSTRTFTDYAPTDWWFPTAHMSWEPIGVSPVLRFMKYEKGGKHFAHYDAGYNYPNDDRRTLMSLVFYLSSHAESEGGATRFIADGLDNTPVQKRDHQDWTRPVNLDEVIVKSQPRKGSVLMFDHRMCHDVEEFTGEARFIIRADLVFRPL